MTTTTHPKGTHKMAATPETHDRTETQPTLTDYSDPETVAKTVPKPWNNATLLKTLYVDRDYSAGHIATVVFEGAVCTETVRRRLHDFELMTREPTLAEQLEAADPGDCGDPLPEAFNGGGAA